MGRMLVRLDSTTLHQRVSPIEKFTYVTTIVLLNCKFSSWMHLHEAVGVQDKVIEDEQRNACSNPLVNLF